MNNYDLYIRPATLDDLPILNKFEQGVVSAERPMSANLKNGEVKYYDLELLIDSPKSELLVASINDKLVACGYARIEANKRHLTPAYYAYLGFMYVLPKFRGNNINGQIIEALLEWSRAQGIDAFKLDVYAANDPAIHAYQKMGFSSNMLEMWMRVKH